MKFRFSEAGGEWLLPFGAKKARELGALAARLGVPSLSKTFVVLAFRVRVRGFRDGGTYVYITGTPTDIRGTAVGRSVRSAQVFSTTPPFPFGVSTDIVLDKAGATWSKDGKVFVGYNSGASRVEAVRGGVTYPFANTALHVVDQESNFFHGNGAVVSNNGARVAMESTTKTRDRVAVIATWTEVSPGVSDYVTQDVPMPPSFVAWSGMEADGTIRHSAIASNPASAGGSPGSGAEYTWYIPVKTKVTLNPYNASEVIVSVEGLATTDSSHWAFYGGEGEGTSSDFRLNPRDHTYRHVLSKYDAASGTWTDLRVEEQFNCGADTPAPEGDPPGGTPGSTWVIYLPDGHYYSSFEPATFTPYMLDARPLIATDGVAHVWRLTFGSVWDLLLDDALWVGEIGLTTVTYAYCGTEGRRAVVLSGGDKPGTHWEWAPGSVLYQASETSPKFSKTGRWMYAGADDRFVYKDGALVFDGTSQRMAMYFASYDKDGKFFGRVRTSSPTGSPVTISGLVPRTITRPGGASVTCSSAAGVRRGVLLVGGVPSGTYQESVGEFDTDDLLEFVPIAQYGPGQVVVGGGAAFGLTGTLIQEFWTYRMCEVGIDPVTGLYALTYGAQVPIDFGTSSSDAVHPLVTSASPSDCVIKAK